MTGAVFDGVPFFFRSIYEQVLGFLFVFIDLVVCNDHCERSNPNLGFVHLRVE
jgi:hypothetical protein